MATCTVMWRPSSGRGEFEYVPADSLLNRTIDVLFEPLDVTIPAEVRGEHVSGKPRLRKFDANNRGKFHLPQLVMAVARLPEPARQDRLHAVTFPLRNKQFLISSMDFDVIEDDGETATLAPLRVSILHSNVQIDLQDRLKAIAADFANIAGLSAKHPDVAKAVEEHRQAVMAGVNSTVIRTAADKVVKLLADEFGMTNAGSAVTLETFAALPETPEEAPISGKEGRLLTRIHVYKERDKDLAKRVKKDFRKKNDGRLHCEACGMVPTEVYGEDGESCMDAHHKIPIEELQPDSVTLAEDMAILCASCHRIVHSKKPCLTVAQVQELLAKAKKS